MFRVFGIQLSLHWSFLLLVAYAGLAGWGEGGWADALLSVGLILTFFFCVVLHELGHSLTARRFGVKVPRILLLPIGGMAEFDRIPRQPAAEFLITLAGPTVNFVIVLVLWLLVGPPAGFPWHPNPEDSFRGLGQLLLNWNFLMGCFNLLPIFPMDGGRLLRSLLAVRLPYLVATRWAANLGRSLSAAIVLALGVYVGWFWLTGRQAQIEPQAYMLGLLFSFICYAGGLEYRMTLRRDREDRYLQDLAHRLALVPPSPSDAPPSPLSVHGPN